MLRDALDGVVRGEDCALLPADEMGEVVACEVGLALRFFELLVGGVAAGEVVVGEAAQGIRDLRPGDVDGLAEQVGPAGVEYFDSLARGCEFGFHGWECAEGSGLSRCGATHAHAADVLTFGSEPCDEDASGREEFVGGIPDDVDLVFEEGDAAVDVVLFFPEARRLPGYFIEREHRHPGEGLLGFGGEVVFGFGEDRDGHGADAEVGVDGLGCARSGIGDGDAAVGGGDLGDGTVVVDYVAERLCEAVGDTVHAADGLEHGGLPIDLLFVEFAGCQFGGEEL